MSDTKKARHLVAEIRSHLMMHPLGNDWPDSYDALASRSRLIRQVKADLAYSAAKELSELCDRLDAIHGRVPAVKTES